MSFSDESLEIAIASVNPAIPPPLRVNNPFNFQRGCRSRRVTHEIATVNFGLVPVIRSRWTKLRNYDYEDREAGGGVSREVR